MNLHLLVRNRLLMSIALIASIFAFPKEGHVTGPIQVRLGDLTSQHLIFVAQVTSCRLIEKTITPMLMKDPMLRGAGSVDHLKSIFECVLTPKELLHRPANAQPVELNRPVKTITEVSEDLFQYRNLSPQDKQLKHRELLKSAAASPWENDQTLIFGVHSNFGHALKNPVAFSLEMKERVLLYIREGFSSPSSVFRKQP